MQSQPISGEGVSVALVSGFSGEVDSPLRRAMAASSEGEASLNALACAVDGVSRGFAGAREANELLIDELSRVRRQLTQSETVRRELEQTLSQFVEQQAEAQLAWARAEAEREQVLEEQDAFLASLIEEHEEELTERLRAATAEERARAQKQGEAQRWELEQEHRAALQLVRDNADEQVREALAEMERRLVAERTSEDQRMREAHEQELAAQRAEQERLLAAQSAELEAALQRANQLAQAEAGHAARERIQATEPGAPLPESGSELEQLRQELADARAQIDALAREREHSRDMLRRLHSQRDEAQRSAAELKRSLTPGEGTARPDSGRASGTLPKRNTQSELAAALAATDPKLKRRNSSHNPLTDSRKPPLPSKPDAAQRPLVGYSMSDVDPEETTPSSSHRT